MTPPIALTIAGSDSGGGAGIQADIKTFSALGTYGCSAITALTAQNTTGVHGILGISPDFIRAQIDAVFDDIPVAAVKIGMLANATVIETVATALERWDPPWIVLDPVMVAKGGAPLLELSAIDALRTRLLPLASIVTPNLPEAAFLARVSVPSDRDSMPDLANAVLRLGCGSVLLKGGHLESGDSPDLLVSSDETLWFEGTRHETRNTHGTGCTLSAAIAALLASGLHVRDAVAEAKRYVYDAIVAADTLNIGKGHGPVHHFHRTWLQPTGFQR